MIRSKLPVVFAVAGAAFLAPAAAAAMCGCMMPVDDTGIPESTQLVSDATQVVLMRHGTKTIQTMQNRYEGPVEDFGIVIPTPEILTEDSVKVLYPEVFENIDRVSAPVLTEYWQHDPCEGADDDLRGFATADAEATNSGGGTGNVAPPADPGVVVEAEFQVGEYQIQVVSAVEGTDLETWLIDNGYRIPQGASKYLQPYLDQGMYFFVAKVDAEKVTFRDGRAQLSPLRFHYDTDTFSLPTRLGMINSNGRQDLLVYTLGEHRYDAANQPTATIPTNVPVVASVKDDFPRFYDQLFEETLAATGNAVVTEYSSWAWQLPWDDISSLGGDVVAEVTGDDYFPYNLVLTRMHLRYEKDETGEDLVFEVADPITGGQEAWGSTGTVNPTVMEQGAVTNDFNQHQFRAHYLIKHAWTGSVDCANPIMDRWGGPIDGDGLTAPTTVAALSPNTTNVEVWSKLGKQDLPVAALIAEDVPEIGLEREVPPKNEPSGCSAAGAAMPGGLAILLLGFVGGARRRRR